MKNEMRSEITYSFWLNYVVFLYSAWKNVKKKISYFATHLIFHRFSPFNCCLSVLLWLDKGDYPRKFADCVFVLKNSVFFVAMAVILHLDQKAGQQNSRLLGEKHL